MDKNEHVVVFCHPKVVVFCNPKTAEKFICGEDAKLLQYCIVMSRLIPEGEMTLVPKDEFLEWLKGKKE